MRAENTHLKDKLEKISDELNKLRLESEMNLEKNTILETERDTLREEINQLEVSFVEVETERKKLEESSTETEELQTRLRQNSR